MARKTFRGTKIPERGRCRITPEVAGRRGNVRDVEECAKVCSNLFFEKDTLRFFDSRIGEDAYSDGRGGAYFATSEQGPHGPRGYTVRHYNAATCRIQTHGKYQGHASMDAAKAAAKRAATGRGLGRRKRR